MRRIALGLVGCLLLAVTGCCCHKHGSCVDACSGWGGCDDPCGAGMFDGACGDCCSSGCGTSVGCSDVISPSCAAPTCGAPSYSAMPSNCPECAAPHMGTPRGAYLQPPLTSAHLAPQVQAPVTYDATWQTLPAQGTSTLNEPAPLRPASMPYVNAY